MRNPEEPYGYSKEKLKEGEFNPILSSQKFNLGPGRYRLDHLPLDHQMAGIVDRRNNYNETRKINLPYKKFITLEIHSGEQFALRFHKFYDEGIKNKIRGIPGSRFLMDQRCWVLGIASYDFLINELKKLCEQNSIHIDEIPSFIMNLVLHKTPFTGPDILMGNFNYTNDKFVR